MNFGGDLWPVPLLTPASGSFGSLESSICFNKFSFADEKSEFITIDMLPWYRGRSSARLDLNDLESRAMFSRYFAFGSDY